MKFRTLKLKDKLVHFSAAGMVQEGFQDPVLLKAIDRLDVLGYRGAPDIEGIYAILHPAVRAPKFLASDHPRRINETPNECLAKRWVDTAEVLYVGKAPYRKVSVKGKRNALWQRIKEYQAFVYRAGINHAGGEDLRRIAHRDDVLVTWKFIENPSEAERLFMVEFTERYGKRPFANRNDGLGRLLTPKCR